MFVCRKVAAMLGQLRPLMRHIERAERKEIIVVLVPFVSSWMFEDVSHIILMKHVPNSYPMLCPLVSWLV